MRWGYTADQNNGTISIYAIDASTADLRPHGYAPAGLLPTQVVVSPDQRFAFATSTTGKVAAFSTTKSGVLIAAAGSPFDAGSGSGMAAVHPSNAFLYVANHGSDDVTAFAIDQSSGALTPIGSSVTAGDGPSVSVVSPDGAYLYVVNDVAETVSTFAIDAGTGALTPVGSAVASAPQPTSIAVNPDGSALYVGFRGLPGADGKAGVSSYAIDSSTGALTAADTVFSDGFGSDIEVAIAVPQSGKYVLAAYLGPSDLRVYATGPAGDLTVVDQHYDIGSPADVAVDHSGNHVFVTDYAQKAVYSLTLDQDTGLLAAAHAVVSFRDPRNIALLHGDQALVSTSRFALVTNQDDDTVSTYTIDASDGALVSAGTVSTADTPVGVDVTLDGRLTFVSSETGNSVASYDTDPITGALTATGSSVTTGTQPLVVVAGPSGGLTFTSNFGGNGVSRLSVSSNGTLASLGITTVGTSPLGMALHPTGSFLFVAERGQNTATVFSVNGSTGALSKVGCCPTAGTGTQPTWVTVSPRGTLVFVSNFGSDDVSVFGIDTLNYGLTGGAKYAAGDGPFGLAVDPQEQYLFVANSSADSITRFRINSNGSLTNLGTATDAGGVTPMTLAMDATGERLYVLNQGSDEISVFSVDRATGDLTAFGAPIPTGARPATIVVHTSLD